MDELKGINYRKFNKKKTLNTITMTRDREKFSLVCYVFKSLNQQLEGCSYSVDKESFT